MNHTAVSSRGGVMGPGVRGGLLMRLGSVLLWSFSGPLIWLGSSRVSPWQFLAVAGIVGGASQWLFSWRRGRLEGCFQMPVRLWLAMIIGIVAYNLLYPVALAGSEGRRAVGLNLVNYLWPVLTVLLAVAIVPGTRMTLRLALAILLALGGLALANWRAIEEMRREGWGAIAPYVMVGLPALCWSTYTALLSRWKSWSRRYATAPAGFLLVGLIASAVCTVAGQWRALSIWEWAVLIVACAANYGGVYLFWELALQRSSAAALGILASFIPAGSTLLMCLVTLQKPSLGIAAAGVVSLAAALCVARRGNGSS